MTKAKIIKWLESLKKEIGKAENRTLWHYAESIDMAIEVLSTDAVEVVKCKDCKYRNEKCGMGEHRWCKVFKMSTVPNDFCSYGKRREDSGA